jgi:hypothetical protein
MSGRDSSQRAPRPTCEDYYDDFEDAAVDTRPPANVAAKRSKPELLPKASFERCRNDGNDSGYGSRTGTAGSGSPNRREKKVVNLKVDTNIEERESRPYRYAVAKTEARQTSTRPADPAAPKTVEPKMYYKHPEGECWVCDKFGKHVDPPKGTPVPISPTVARRPSVTEYYADTQTSQGQPRVRRSSSNQGSRPASMYASTASVGLYDTKSLPSPFPQEAPSYATTSWQTTTTPWAVHYTPLTPVTYTQYPVVASSQMATPTETQGSYFQSPPVRTRPARPAEPGRRASMYDQSDRPVVQQSIYTSAKSREENERVHNRRPPLYTQKSSHDRDLDHRAMPPPPRPQQEQVLLAHRPSLKKAATSTPATTLRRYSQSYGSNANDFPRMETLREGRAETSVPPTSYRGPSAALQNRPPNRKPESYNLPRQSVEVATRAVPVPEPLGRRRAEPSPVERHEAEAEAYQRKRGTSDLRGLQSHNLTAEALRKVPKVTAITTRSETNSSQKSRNSSSKGSSGGKTGPSSSDITMNINGIAFGIPADSGQRITIQSKGVNISVGGKGRNTDKEYGGSQVRHAPSIMSKTNNSRGKEKRLEHDSSMRVLRDDERHILDRAGSRSQSISRYVSRDQEEEPIAYGA